MSLVSRVPVRDTLSKERYRVGKLDRSDYKSTGPIPIIDQGHDDIAGYTTRRDLAYQGPLPVVVFGDHTRSLKLVTVPFVAGADGTKVLVPDVKLVDPRYYFYALKSLDIPSRGYNRHYSLLCEQSIAVPPRNDQERIATILARVENALAANRRVADSAWDLRTATMNRLFADVDNWPRLRIGEFCRTSSGGTPRRGVDGYYGGDIPWVKSGEVTDGWIDHTEEAITAQALEQSSARLYPAGTLLLAMYGATAGQVGELAIEAATNQAVCALEPDSRVASKYLFYVLQRARSELRNERYGGAQPNLSQQTIRNFAVPIPDKPRQLAIVTALGSMDAAFRASMATSAALDEMFRSTLRNLIGRAAA